jgi:hypothetical protein
MEDAEGSGIAPRKATITQQAHLSGENTFIRLWVTKTATINMAVFL